MASALLASRNESYWGERKVYMRKTPNPNPNSSLRPNPGPNPKPNPNPGPNGRDHASDYQNPFHAIESEEAPAAGQAGTAAVVSDDSSSLNRKSIGLNHRRESGGYVAFKISTFSRKELRELKRRLVSELDQVRSVTSRIESRELQSSARSVGYSTSGIYCGGREVSSSALDSLVPGSDGFMEKRSYQPADKKTSANRAPLPVISPRDLKQQPSGDLKKHLSAMMKKCGQILAKLMKHKGSVWFNSPVDVVGMGLHDYHQIIKHPMDLGSVKSNLNKGLYTSPLEFASDVRLTFKNALIYNPQGHEVHKLAEQLLHHFETLFVPAYEKFEKQQNAISREEEEGHRTSPWSRVPMPEIATRADPIPVSTPLAQTLAPALPPNQSRPVPQPLPPPQPQPQQQQPIVPRLTMGKQPKPKAKDPNKRPMSLEEKHKLSISLQSLPQEKMHQVLQIMRKRNVVTSQDGDEIELDFEVMDTETLWELDRFVCNCKKMMSKIKRQEAMSNHLITAPASVSPCPPQGGSKSPRAGETPEALASKKSKKGDTCEEDVDIGDEMPSTNYPSVEIEKDAVDESSSSSSGSDSSSSSDSDSGSSSGSDSDEDDAQSPAVGSRPSPRKLTTGFKIGW